MALQAAGIMPIVCPVEDDEISGIMPIVCPVEDDEISGIGIFNTGPDEARAVMADDPGVRTGIFTVEVHTCRGFPGDALPS